MARELAKSEQPFASVVFTLSSHNPYKLPARYQQLLPKGEQPIHQSIGYTDHSIRMFFETAEKMAWYANTLFIITGDHTEIVSHQSRPFVDAYRVPLIFFHPGRKLPRVSSSKVTQHTDITASVMDYLGPFRQNTAVWPFGF